ncbi:uncharacterized protein LOC110108718 [Dendrobium catenatum]|uniref:uncharacterized protein LOC110108718 n=3 Tax=Dendrobium catenatum TaxID=906689 RepID=UPI0010A07F6E|nr:uncharacterized protein LOC110108718 [Dendrobium catenatum]
MVRGKEKGSSSLRRDPSWKYSVQVDIGGGEKSYVYLKCNFCEKVVKGGVTRMKEHLSCSHKNVAPCAKVPDNVKEEICAYMKKTTTVKHLQQQQFDERVDQGAYFGSESGKGSSSTIHNRGARGPMDQYMTTAGADRGEAEMMPAAGTREGRRQVCMDIGRFFFENAIPFNVATSPAYFSMMRSVGLYGRGLKAPSMYELRTWILKEELQNTERTIGEIKRTWIETGVTIMSDGWSDMKSRSLINILVNNPYGTVFLRSVEASDEVKNATFIFNLLDGVIEEIGEQLVVQVVTDNASAYKAAGQMLMEKRTHLYWTPCAAHCIDLILEDLGDLPQHKSALVRAKKITKFIYNHSWVLSLMRKFSKKEIIRPATTRFATSYLTLQSLMEVRQPLEAMFTSTEWLNSAWGKKSEGKEIRKIILNDKFWATVTYAILSTRPLVQVLRLVDAEKKLAMGFIYNAMDEAKELIAHNLGGEEASYREIWDIVDARWEVQLHRHLHAAAYYLNPQFQYSEKKSSNPEVKLGLYHCMERLIPEQADRELADLQLVLFRNKEGFFGLNAAKTTISKRSPVEWWIQFGDSTPELQSFAVRVLGLTCSSSGCERNWSTYSQVQTKRRNRLSTLRMNSLVYIMHNKRLRDRRLRNKGLKDDEDPLVCDDLSSDNEWFIDDEADLSLSDLQVEDLNVDVLRGEADQTGTSTSTTPHTSTSSASKGKRKVSHVEDEDDMAFIDTIGEEDSLED